jgi:hypothetical protein
MTMKTSVTLPLIKKTPGALLYALPDRTATIVSNVYVRKEHMPMVNGEYPAEIVVTVEAAE